MQISLDQPVALVTGASSGIGAGAAKALAAAGAAVVINYNSHAAPAEELARQINAAGDCGFSTSKVFAKACPGPPAKSST